MPALDAPNADRDPSTELGGARKLAQDPKRAQDSRLDQARSTQQRMAQDAEEDDRRGSGSRNRRSDRLMDRATREYPRSAALRGVNDVENLLLFIDDDMRETALAMSRIESFLVRTLKLLEAPKLTREQVNGLANDRSVIEHVDMLNETLESLRRRMARLAGRLR